MGTLIDLTGQHFAHLKVLAFAGIAQGRQAMWRCICSCGNKRVVRGTYLRSGRTKSCGCLTAKVAKQCHTKHGHTKHGSNSSPTYRSWSAMLQRCTNPNHRKFHAYGGAGVTVCKAWRTFKGFYLSMGKRPEGTTLGRFRDSGNYKPSNCAWMTPTQQGREQRKKNSYQEKNNG